MTKENKHKSLPQAMAAIMAMMQEPYKGAKGHNATFVPANELKTHLRSACKDHGVYFTQDVKITDSGRDLCRTTITHESGESKEYFYPIMWSSPQKGGALHWSFQGGLTYASRYALMLAFGIYGEKDKQKIVPMESTAIVGSGETDPNEKFESSDFTIWMEKAQELLKATTLPEFMEGSAKFRVETSDLNVSGAETAVMNKMLGEKYEVLNEQAIPQQPMEAAE